MPTQNPPYFAQLRDPVWTPRFHWEPCLRRCAGAINRPHEDYPRRVTATEHAIRDLTEQHQDTAPPLRITQDLIREVHRIIFPDHGDRAGQWRQANVQVGRHLPPHWELLPRLMHELERRYIALELTPETLRQWYFDFETIHPFRDGNGRVGGVIVAAISRDGSRVNTITGGAPQTTNNRMELSAVIEALQAVNAIPDFDHDPITVRSDSNYVIQAFNQRWLENWQKNGWRNSKKQPVPNRDLWEDLLEQVQDRAIAWEWVKGHSGDRWNEECDRLAVEQSHRAAREPRYYVANDRPAEVTTEFAGLVERLDRELERLAARLPREDHPGHTAIAQARHGIHNIQTNVRAALQCN